MLSRLLLEIDEGEAEAISLACSLKADRLLIDEKLGREIAIREGLSIIGLIGILMVAKEKQLVPSIRPLLDQLQEAGFYLAAEVKRAALRSSGETLS